MRTMAYLFIGLAFLAVLTGCASIRAQYDIELKEVERPAQAKERYGEQKIITRTENGVNKFLFEDEMVRILWVPTPNAIHFSLVNKTSHSIKIVWDEAAYVDVNGSSHRVMHSGIKFMDKNSPQPPTIVVRGGSIEDLVFPTDNVYFSSGAYGGWTEVPLFPTAGYTVDELRSKAEPFKSRLFQVLLPLQIEDVVNEYIFIFEIKDVIISQSYK